MRRLLGSVLPAALLAALPLTALSACGDDAGGTATDDRAPTASRHPSTDATDEPSEGAVDFRLLRMLTETAAGGAVSPVGVPLGDADAARAFNEQFETDALPARIQELVETTHVPDDMLLYGAVVSIGCDAPTDVLVAHAGSEVAIVAQKVPHPLRECFAPMTTVALVLVPVSAV
jgi:hypothetical protein